MTPTATTRSGPAPEPAPGVPAPGVPAPGVPAPGVSGDPRWARPALLVLLAGTAALYLWDLGASGWANAFYAAAAQAGSVSWEALFFGSSDAGSSITVDKPPASLWVMALSVRVFGLSSWSLLVPEALMGVGSVWLLHGTVRRVVDARAGLLAGLALAVTPVAALVLRVDDPDALLVLLMTGAACAVLRAVQSTRTSAQTRWLLLAGVLVGLGFLTKQLQAFLVLPALGVTHLSSGRPGVRDPGGAWCSSGRRGPDRTSAARRTTASWASPSATTASDGSRATRPAPSGPPSAPTARATGARPGR